jgi:hypothetical protein
MAMLINMATIYLMANSLLAGVGGFLTGGLNSFNTATAADDERKQKAAQLALQQEQMRRAIANDERTAAYQDAQLIQQGDQQKSLDDERQFRQGESIINRGYKGTLTPEQVAMLHPTQRALAVEETPRGPLDSIPQIGTQNPDGSLNAPPNPDGTPQLRFRESESERMQIANINAQARAQQFATTQGFNDRKLAQDRDIATQRILAQIAGQNNRSEPLVPVLGPDGKTPTLVPQSQAAGMQPYSKPTSTGAGSASSLPASQKTALVGAQTARDLINGLSDQFVNTGVRNYMGPAMGRLASAFQDAPGTKIHPDFAKFRAGTARLRNATIQAITGAAVGVQEEKRILAEIPSETDKPEAWEIKAQQTLENIASLENAIYSVSGITPPGATPPAGAGSAPPPPAANTGARAAAPAAGTPTAVYDWVNGKLVRKS